MSNALFQSVPLSSIGEAEGDVSLSGIEQRSMLMNKLSRAPQTRVLCLRNMLKDPAIKYIDVNFKIMYLRKFFCSLSANSNESFPFFSAENFSSTPTLSKEILELKV